MSEVFKREIVQHIVRNLLDVQLLRIVQAGPTWGYRIKKQVEAESGVRLRHGALYPALKVLQDRGFVESRRQRESGRVRKVYVITEAGRVYLQTYYGVLLAQLKGEDGWKTG